MFFDQAVVQRIKEIAQKRRISYARWSIKAGISSTTIYDIVHGKSACPSLITIKKLCDAIHMPITEFFNTDEILNATVEEEEDWGDEEENEPED